jgi:hypothetical protein
MELINVQKIWDKASHNAFTDLIRFNNEWLCIFREGETHVSLDGALRIISSTDARQWRSSSLIKGESDFRDGKLCLTPQKQLMVCGAEVVIEGSTRVIQSVVWFSKDGHVWGPKNKIAEGNSWLWRITWHEGIAYSMAYHCGQGPKISLYSSQDGVNFSVLAPCLVDEGVPTEASLLFENGLGYCLLRRNQANGLLGIAKPPYTYWIWKDLGVFIGGPQLISLPENQVIAAVRLYDNKVRTSLCRLNLQTGEFKEALELPSGGDTSYPGLVWHQRRLWVSYYSSHEGRASIYFAEVDAIA